MTKKQLEEKLSKCQKKRESAEEEIIKLNNDLKNVKKDKLWNFLSFITGVFFLLFVLYMDIDGSLISVDIAGGKFDGNGLYVLSFAIMFGNRIINMFGSLASFRIVKSKEDEG